MSTDAGTGRPENQEPDPSQSDPTRSDPSTPATDGHQDVGDQDEHVPDPQVDPATQASTEGADVTDAGDPASTTAVEGGESDGDDAHA